MKSIPFGLIALLLWVPNLFAQVGFLDPRFLDRFPDPEAQFRLKRTAAVFSAPEDPDGRLSMPVKDCKDYLAAQKGGYQPQGAADFKAAFEYRDCLLLNLFTHAKPSPKPTEFPVLEELDLGAYEPFSQTGANNLKELAMHLRGILKPQNLASQLEAPTQQMELRWVAWGDLDGQGGEDLLLQVSQGPVERYFLVLADLETGTGWLVRPLDRWDTGP
ncbi:MAG: hypothetical protein A2600_01350 [Candidatus Lambdaproteobacteria bacterium RIFOXYD1_FULL_56_27]|uniref:Uncharacterized protein n=1 Tax=Candidatus Lambdaproteobacteria bacterium RIFOXYD2_FULL_56_26 TaxID=1817773 RepID=A0A1F6GSB2_9PROT|nr:MAG: hypothetical protein A2557_00465 [Candidatus Lambdaproteobacteria bacterium RIFOXYD2_FULL_56_26]OGH01380.1 MAG: hypothetical protein A2426_13300 [Candidatus Lambdaproteobacteria bacterium RIFOXYC1_FULL_56_13]OGH06921.1 MAG: hypothetical protein A2600_01350 [Candidatus Lambdaproteobacteria bacterium RIFOXYD1_FULL_56_27]